MKKSRFWLIFCATLGFSGAVYCSVKDELPKIEGVKVANESLMQWAEVKDPNAKAKDLESDLTTEDALGIVQSYLNWEALIKRLAGTGQVSQNVIVRFGKDKNVIMNFENEKQNKALCREGARIIEHVFSLLKVNKDYKKVSAAIAEAGSGAAEVTALKKENNDLESKNTLLEQEKKDLQNQVKTLEGRSMGDSAVSLMKDYTPVPLTLQEAERNMYQKLACIKKSDVEIRKIDNTGKLVVPDSDLVAIDVRVKFTQKGASDGQKYGFFVKKKS